MNDYKELIERMRAFNDWRRGGDFEMPHPRQIGMDIDAMCDAVESLLAENERLNHNLTSTEQTMREYQELEEEVNSEHIKWLETLGYSCVSRIILDISDVIVRFEQSGPSLPREGWAMIDNIKSKLRMLKND